MTPSPDDRTPSTPAPSPAPQPTERDIDEAVEESFPASDPPSTTPLHSGAPSPAAPAERPDRPAR